MIPKEAIEVAAEVLNRLAGIEPGEDMACAVLEAVAPYLKAEAWDEGWEAGSNDETDSYWGPSAVTTPNPYRNTNE